MTKNASILSFEYRKLVNSTPNHAKLTIILTDIGKSALMKGLDTSMNHPGVHFCSILLQNTLKWAKND